jgi:hypothetical protein
MNGDVLGQFSFSQFASFFGNVTIFKTPCPTADLFKHDPGPDLGIPDILQEAPDLVQVVRLILIQPEHGGVLSSFGKLNRLGYQDL